jgi:excisionase family DNA binding protein
MALRDNYFTISEAAKATGHSRQTISRWVATGKIPAEKVGRETLIERVELFQFIEQRNDIWFDKVLPLRLIDFFRKEYNYDKEDKIARVGDEYDFLVTKKDGTLEKIEVKNFHISFKKGRKAELQLEEVLFTPYEKSRNKKTEQNPGG